MTTETTTPARDELDRRAADVERIKVAALAYRAAEIEIASLPLPPGVTVEPTDGGTAYKLSAAGLTLDRVRAVAAVLGKGK